MAFALETKSEVDEKTRRRRAAIFFPFLSSQGESVSVAPLHVFID